MPSVAQQEILNPTLRSGGLIPRMIRRIDHENDLSRRIGSGCNPVVRGKRNNLCRLTVVEHGEVCACQSGYSLPCFILHCHIKMNAAFPFVSCRRGRNRRRGRLLRLRQHGNKQQKQKNPSLLLFHTFPSANPALQISLSVQPITVDCSSRYSCAPSASACRPPLSNRDN